MAALRVFALFLPTVLAIQNPTSVTVGSEPAFHLAAVIDSLIGRIRFIGSDTSVSCNDQAVRVDIIIHRDSAGLVRRLVVDAGSGDSSDRTSYYYDGAGRLRTAYATRGATNGTNADQRVAFDPDGKVIRRYHRLIAGPGYPFPSIVAVPNPQAWLTNVCQ